MLHPQSRGTTRIVFFHSRAKICLQFDLLFFMKSCALCAHTAVITRRILHYVVAFDIQDNIKHLVLESKTIVLRSSDSDIPLLEGCPQDIESGLSDVTWCSSRTIHFPWQKWTWQRSSYGSVARRDWSTRCRRELAASHDTRKSH